MYLFRNRFNRPAIPIVKSYDADVKKPPEGGGKVSCEAVKAYCLAQEKNRVKVAPSYYSVY